MPPLFRSFVRIEAAFCGGSVASAATARSSRPSCPPASYPRGVFCKPPGARSRRAAARPGRRLVPAPGHVAVFLAVPPTFDLRPFMRRAAHNPALVVL